MNHKGVDIIKKSDLKVGDKIILIVNGAGAFAHLEITDINYEHGIIGMGTYACSLKDVHRLHKYVRKDGTLEEIIDE